MQLPFTTTEFLAVFAAYNTAIWPLQLAFVVLAVAAVLAVFAGRRDRTRSILMLLAGWWLWMGVVYHGYFFRKINPAALAFAALFVLQAGLLAVAAVRRTPGRFRFSFDPPGVVGSLIIAYALAGYPMLSHTLGHHYPFSPTFGLPCPTTLFTIGMLLVLRPLRASLLIIPLLWAAIGFTAALKLGIYQDAGLLVAGLAALAIIFIARRWEPAAPVANIQPPADSSC